MSGRREYRKRQWKRRQSEKLTMLLKGSIAVAVVLVLVLTGVKIVSTVQNHKQQKQAEEALLQKQKADVYKRQVFDHRWRSHQYERRKRLHGTGRKRGDSGR